MPPNDRRRLNDDEQLRPFRIHTTKPNPKHPVQTLKRGARPLPFQHSELLPQRQVLDDQLHPRAEQRQKRTKNEFEHVVNIAVRGPRCKRSDTDRSSFDATTSTRQALRFKDVLILAKDNLTELLRHYDELSDDPARWLPWTYRETRAPQS
jgi:hypothetical protein